MGRGGVMIVRTTHSRFVAPILARAKTTTIRPTPWPIGLVELREWSGRPYHSRQVPVAVVYVKATQRFILDLTNVSIGALNHLGLPKVHRHDDVEYLDTVARMDGFMDWFTMRDWFAAMYDLPFEGFRMHFDLVGRPVVT
jgi:hypothetical protein